METEEARLARLLASVEREERFADESRPTGAIVRELFPGEDVAETAVDSEDESGEGEEVQELPGDVQDIFNNSDIDVDDFGDIECIPLKQRMSENIVIRPDGKEAYMSKSRKMLWNVQPKGNAQTRTPRRNILRMRMGCVAQSSREAVTPVEVWNLFFDNNTIQDITNYTNIYINTFKERFSRERDSKTTNPAEIKAVIGVIYMAGVMRSSHHNLEDLYANDGTGVEFFRCVIALSRLKFLLRSMRFDDITTREERKSIDKLAPIRDLFDAFVQKCQNRYIVSEFVTVDEMLESFRGRCAFRQYMRSKPAKYGLKVYAMVCAKTFYTANLEVYVGSQPDGPYVVNNSSKDVVLRMIEPISGSGRNVTIDNFFTSIPLWAELIQEHRLTVVGTLRKNKAEIPASFIDTKDRPVGSSCFAFRNACTLVSYKAKKNKDVVLLSSMHDSDNVDMTVDSRTYEKPDIILFYNSTKGGVDTVDKYKESYSTARITNRWSMRLFYTILDVGCLNSYIILKKNINQPIIRRKFIKDLAFNLCKEYGHQRLYYRNIPKQLKNRMCDILGIEQHQHQRDPPPDEITSGRCYVCTWKKNRPSKTRCTQCKLFICREHTVTTCANCNNEEEEMDVALDSDST